MIKKIFLILFLCSSIYALEYPVKDIYNPRPTRPEKKGVRVEIVIKDNLTDENVDKIASVYFNNKQVPLTKRDYLGNRGQTYLRASPGRHTIRWTVRNDAVLPRVQNYQEEITIPNSASLIYIEIYRDKLTFDVIQ